MFQYLIYIIIGVVGVYIGYRLAVGRNRKKGFISRQIEEKEKNKKKTLELFKDKKEVKNNDVEKLLNVSDATATNYLSELEKEGKIIQIGERGRGVYYKKKG